MSNKKTGMRYKDAGVDIDAGEALVQAIKPIAKATARDGVEPSLGGFGAIFDPKAAGYRDPILVAGTDGVGTKLKLAIQATKFDTIGIDLVAMCANDIIVQGAEPLFFLDYFATARLDVDQATAIVAGIGDGCKQAGCALIGGETAEMPGMYRAGDFDLAGFVVGAVERDRLLTGADIAPGDVILGLASSGAHSNGYSLIRKIIDHAGLELDDPAPFQPDVPLSDAFLTPTRIYVRSLIDVVRRRQIKGLAHITGGGLLENIPRCLPHGTCARLDASSWRIPPVFDWLQNTGNLTQAELARTFNCGIGMAAVVDADHVIAVERHLSAMGETVFRIGQIAATDGAACITIDGPGGLWGAENSWTIGTGESQ